MYVHKNVFFLPTRRKEQLKLKKRNQKENKPFVMGSRVPIMYGKSKGPNNRTVTTQDLGDLAFGFSPEFPNVSHLATHEPVVVFQSFQIFQGVTSPNFYPLYT